MGGVPAGTGKVVEAGGKTLALFNLGGTFYALDNRCTHLGGPPARRPAATFRVHAERDEIRVERP